MNRLYTFIVFTVILGSWNLNASAQNVSFPDANLAAKVRTALNLASGANIPLTSLQGLDSLSADNAGITNLTGLEQATGLERLYLDRNQISDLSPLSSLSDLDILSFRNNQISDLSPLSGLTSLTQLLLSNVRDQANNNQIRDLSPLSGLTSLTELWLNNNPISNFDPLSGLTNLKTLHLTGTNFSNVTILSSLTSLTGLRLGDNGIGSLTGFPALPNLTNLQLEDNQISDLSPLGNLTSPTKLVDLGLTRNQITDVTPLARFTGLTQLWLENNQITDVTPLGNLINLQWRLVINNNQVRDLIPLSSLTKLQRLHFEGNQVSDLSPLSSLTELTDLRFDRNQVSDLSPLSNLTELQLLAICYNRYTDISPIATLVNLQALRIDEVFVAANQALVAATTNARLVLCPPLTGPGPVLVPPVEPEAFIETPTVVKKQKRRSVQCGLGWAPHSQYQHHGELPKVMIYALEFEYDPEGHGRYSCKTIEIRTGDDSIENLAGWNLYLGTLYNPSRIPLKIPEEHSQITDRILRITPEMLGLETFPCNTVNGISHPLPGVQYVLKTDENVLIDTAYSCFIWGQNAYTTVNGKNVESPRRISSQALREMDTPRIERYVTNPTGIFITYTAFENFEWDRAVLSDWLLGSSEETGVDSPNAPLLSEQKLTTSWGAIKTQPILRQRNFKRKPAR